jgi:MoaA/NifB/PqqE/SkfB family radical SAM enzyme
VIRWKKFCRNLRLLSGLGSSIVRARLTRSRRPIFVGLYVTNSCNLRCRYCFANPDNRFATRPKAGFTSEQVRLMVDELYDMGCRWIFLLGGEPLLHPEIGSIVEYIVDKGILIHILTNGTLIEEKIEAIQRADGICVSIDGAEAATDATRGKGTYRKALHGASIALSRGIKTRVHAVLNRRSFDDMETLAAMAAEMGLSISLSPLNYLGCGDNPELNLTAKDYEEFYRRYRQLKRDGYPINNSFFSIEKALRWPKDYHTYIRPDETFPGYEPIRCVIGDTHGCIDSEGTMFNCIQRGVYDGLNIHEVGIKKAWDELPNRRRDCVSCASINTIETSAYLGLRPEIVMDGFRFFFGDLLGWRPRPPRPPAACQRTTGPSEEDKTPSKEVASRSRCER